MKTREPKQPEESYELGAYAELILKKTDRDTCDDIDDEPSFKVVSEYLSVVRDKSQIIFAIVSTERSDYEICYEYEISNHVNDVRPCSLHIMVEEGETVWHEKCNVEEKDDDHN
jgi:hypothetical protein